MKKKGFTLIEMMAIIVILAVIILFSFPSILELISNNDIKNKEEQLSNLYLSTENYIVQNYKDEYNSLPFYITIKELIENDYVRIDDKVTAYEEDDVVEVNKDGNGVWTYTFKENLFDITKVFSSANVVNNNDGTLSVTPKSSGQSVAGTTPNKLADYALGLEVDKTYKLLANTTGTTTVSRHIYLNKSAFQWYFGNTRKITQNDLDSIVYWHANGTDTSFTAVISDIIIIEVS